MLRAKTLGVADMFAIKADADSAPELIKADRAAGFPPIAVLCAVIVLLAARRYVQRETLDRWCEQQCPHLRRGEPYADAGMPLTRINAVPDFWFVPKIYAVWTRQPLFNGTDQNACL
jgi:hypothetical protein